MTVWYAGWFIPTGRPDSHPYRVTNTKRRTDTVISPDDWHIKESKTLKENQREKGLYKRGEANPSRGENPEDKSWFSRMGVGHRASNPIPEKKKTNFAMKSQSSIAGWIFGKRTMQRKRMKAKVKTGRRQLRIEELGETWLRRRKTHKDFFFFFF